MQIASKFLENDALLTGFYSFRQNAHAQLSAKCDDSACDGAAGGIGEKVAHERAVELDLRERQALEIRQG